MLSCVKDLFDRPGRSAYADKSSRTEGCALGFLGKYFRRHGAMFAAAIGCLSIEAFCDLLQPAVMARIIDSGVAHGDIHVVVKLGLLMLGIAGIGALGAVGRNILASSVSQRFGAELRFDLFSKIQRLSQENIDRLETGSLVTRLTNDVTQLQNFVNGLMRIFVKAPLVCAGSIALAVMLDVRMASVLLAVVPVVVILIVLNIRFGYPLFRKVQSMMDGVNTVVREYLSGVRVVKAFNRFEYETRRFSKANNRLAHATASASRVMVFFSPGMMLSVNLGIVAVLWFGGMRVESGGLQVGKVIAFVNYMTQILFSLMMIMMVFTMFVRARASTERISEVMRRREGMPRLSSVKHLSSHEGRVSFENVSFGYFEKSDPVLRDISFSAEPGETVAVIGPTGSGKSTLVNLIPRFYDCSSGRLTVDGIDVRDCDTAELRSMIAMVPQKNLLFSGSIISNIKWGDDRATDEEVFRAASVAQATDFIDQFPEKYGTMLGQGGVNLSGGQKQRIAIARAIIRKPRILILDDSTSAVEIITEGKIMKGLSSCGRMTTFIITQRIVSARGADRIIVLDNGSAAGIGTHDELVRSCDVYRDIFRSQIGEDD
jgi:ATP-binding cassette subfamily B protein